MRFEYPIMATLLFFVIVLEPTKTALVCSRVFEGKLVSACCCCFNDFILFIGFFELAA